MVMPTYNSGFYEGQLGSAGYSAQNGKLPSRRVLTRAFRKRGLQAVRSIINADAVVTRSGGTATASYKRVAADVAPGDPLVRGGVRTIETVTQINAATSTTTSAQISDIVMDTFDRAYNTDLSGNNGGGDLTRQYALK
jgi:hypothetical protein